MDAAALIAAFLNMIAAAIQHDTAMMESMTPDQRLRYVEVVVKDRERLYTIGTLLFGWIDKLAPGAQKPAESLIPRG